MTEQSLICKYCNKQFEWWERRQRREHMLECLRRKAGSEKENEE